MVTGKVLLHILHLTPAPMNLFSIFSEASCSSIVIPLMVKGDFEPQKSFYACRAASFAVQKVLFAGHKKLSAHLARDPLCAPARRKKTNVARNHIQPKNTYLK